MVSDLLCFQLRLSSNGELIYSGEVWGELLCSVERNPLCAEKVLCDSCSFEGAAVDGDGIYKDIWKVNCCFKLNWGGRERMAD